MIPVVLFFIHLAIYCVAITTAIVVLFFFLNKIIPYLVPALEAQDYSTLLWDSVTKQKIHVILSFNQEKRFMQTPVKTIQDLQMITKMSKKEYNEYKLARKI